MDITILGIESSCDDTSAAVIRDRTLLSNVILQAPPRIGQGDEDAHEPEGGDSRAAGGSEQPGRGDDLFPPCLLYTSRYV